MFLRGRVKVVQEGLHGAGQGGLAAAAEDPVQQARGSPHPC